MQPTQEQIDAQIAMERGAIDDGQALYYRRLKNPKATLDTTKPGLTLVNRTLKPMVEAIEAFCAPAQGGGHQQAVKRFFRTLLDPYALAFIAAQRIIMAAGRDETLQDVAMDIAQRVIDEHEQRKFKEVDARKVELIEKNFRSHNKSHRRMTMIIRKHKAGVEDTPVDLRQRLALGTKLIALFISSTGLVHKKLIPLADRHKRGSMYQLVAATETAEWLNTQHELHALAMPRLMPMIIPPRPWTNQTDGGFITLQTELIRMRDKKVKSKINALHLPEVYKAVNALQAIPWRIRTSILDVVQQLWVPGTTGIAKLADRRSKADYVEDRVPTPWVDQETKDQFCTENPEAWAMWRAQRTSAYSDFEANKCRAVPLGSVLRLAEGLKQHPEFYYVWYADYRGRYYPYQVLGPQPQGDDLSRSLIELAHPEPITADGVKWLKVSLSNDWGNDKVSLDDRVKWAEANEAMILACAAAPLDVIEWTKADKPFSFLSMCFEYAGWKRDGDDYLTHCVLGLDGANNGLQHLSACILDERGAQATNVLPSKKPADIYTEVAIILTKMVLLDANSPDERTRLNSAPWVKLIADNGGQLPRWCAKRGTMTTPYGSRVNGMQTQLIKALSDLRMKSGVSICDKKVEEYCCLYLANRLYEAIGQVVIKGRELMNWLQAVARVCNEAKAPICWTTPTGFHVHMQHWAWKGMRVKTMWGTTMVTLMLKEAREGHLDRRRQVNSIAPNFVHSMDAAALSMTINRCADDGIHVSAIHDQYSCTPRHVSKMRDHLRQCFYDLYTETDILSAFRTEVMALVPEHLHDQIPPVPQKGNLDLSAVLESDYFFA